MSTMKRSGFLMVALSLAGCGTVWVDGVHTQRRAVVAGTLEVQARTEVAGGLVIVEQEPGQGFIVEPQSDGYHVVAQASGAASSGVSTSAEIEAGAWCEGECPPPSVASGALTGSSGIAVSASASATVSTATTVSASASGASAGAAASEWNGSGIASEGAGSGVSAGSSMAAGSSVSAGSSMAVGSSSSAGSSMTTGSSTVVGSSSSASSSSSAGIGSIEIEARARVPRDGVWGLDGQATALTAITGPGVQVDGVRVALDELEALASISLPASPSAQLATDGAIEAWAELEHESLPRAGGETHVVVRVRAGSAVQASAPRSRMRVHLVIDSSSSMQRSWERVQAAARALIARLSADDELQIVAYGTDAVEVYPVGRVGDGRAAIAALGQVSVGGGTNIQAGLERAYASASASSRSLVILLSDGVPTRGAFEPAELGALAASARARGATTSVVGLGTEFDARLLRAVARQGHGGYHVSASFDALADGLVQELEAHARFAAQNLRVRVTLGDGVQIVGAPEGGAEVVDGGVLLSTPHLDAGEERRIVLRVRVPGGVRAKEVASVSLDYRSALSGRAVAASRELAISFGARSVLATEGLAGAGVLDASLASALDAAGDAIARGDASAAKRALDEHVLLTEGRVELRRSPALQARVRVVRRLGEAVHALLPAATHPQRRQVAHAFGELAMRFAR